MDIGLPKEIKDHEFRLALLPEAVKVLVKKGHQVRVQRGAGRTIGISDKQFQKAGARIVASARELYRRSQLIVKVKEPLEQEYPFLRPDLWVFGYFHLAANRHLARALKRIGVTAIAYETLLDSEGRTPLLKPMSEIAGRLSTQLGLQYLRSDTGGKGVLLSPTSNSPPGKVLVVGGGNVGRAAAEIAAGLHAQVVVLDRYPAKLNYWSQAYPNIEVLRSNPRALRRWIPWADLVVGAVYIPGARTPQVIRKEMVKKMEEGSVLVDVAVDQGGAAETTHPTSISHPTYKKFGVIHCAVTNLPALTSRTSSHALSQVVFPYVQRLAQKKSVEAILADPKFRGAVNVTGGKILHPGVLKALGK